MASTQKELQIYTIFIKQEDRDLLDEKLNLISANTKLKPNRRIGCIIFKEDNRVGYSIELLPEELLVLKLAVPGKFIRYEGKTEFIWSFLDTWNGGNA